MRGRTFGQWLALFLLLVLFAAVATVGSFVLFTLANYSDTVDRLVFRIKTDDSVETGKELVRLHYFYELSDKWKVRWLADKYLFKDSPFYEPADSYLIRDWQKVINGLKDKPDDPRSYPYGHARFRQAQAQYQAGGTKEVPQDFILNEIVLKEISADFEKALRNCLDSSLYEKCSDRVWNYDLATNKKDAEEALKNPSPKRPQKFMLGPIKDKDAPPMIPDTGKKKEGQDGKEEGGAGSPRKRP